MPGTPLMRVRSAADLVAIDAFFEGRDSARTTFGIVEDFVRSCGPTVLAASKSRVAFVRRTRFLWVHTAHVDGAITMGFLLDRRVESERLRSGPVGRRWSHHVKVAVLDEVLRGWFREAFEADAS